MKRLGLVSIASTALLAACSGSGPSGEQTAATSPANTQETAPPGGVKRETVEPVPAPVAAPVPAAIQTQPGPKGSTVALNKVAVTGDILTVALTYTGGGCCTYTPVDKVSVIDDATSQRIGVLKDNAGNWMAAPLYGGDDKEVRIDSSDKGGAQVWFKFPAPPAGSKTVSINIPEVAPFDAVPVGR